jgi:DNA-binding protein YbaB
MGTLPDYSSADAARETIARQTEEAVERARRATAWRQEIDALRGHGSADRGAVTATVEVSGMLVDLEVTDSAAQRGGRAVGALVVEAVKAAQRDVGRKVMEASEQEWGAESSTTDRMRAEVTGRFGPLDDPGSPGRGLPGADIHWGR